MIAHDGVGRWAMVRTLVLGALVFLVHPFDYYSVSHLCPMSKMRKEDCSVGLTLGVGVV